MSSGQKAIKYLAIGLAIFIILNIVNAIFWSISFFGNFSSKSDIEFTETYSNVSKIKIDLKASKLIITNGMEFKVEASDVSSRFSSKVTKDNTLKIEEHNTWFWHHSSGEIIVTVPNNMPLEELDIDCGAGKIEIQNITSNKLDIDCGAGSLIISDSSFNQADIDGGAGAIDISSSLLRDLDLDAGVGSINIDGEIYGKSKIDSGIGEINLELGKKEDYSLRIEKGLGNVKIDNEEYSNDTTFGSGLNSIKINGGVGSIKINFRAN